ncbi:hypothetical protein QQG55_23750 [Brugia pahangi]
MKKICDDERFAVLFLLGNICSLYGMKKPTRATTDDTNDSRKLFWYCLLLTNKIPTAIRDSQQINQHF